MKINSRPVRAGAAWGLFGLTLATLSVMFGLEAAGCSFLVDPTAETVAEAYGIFNVILWAGGLSTLGLLVTIYRPDNRIGWLTLLMGLVGAFNFSSIAYAACAGQLELILPGLAAVPWITNIAGWLLQTTMGFFLMVFPNGSFISASWRRFSLVVVGLMVIYLPFGLSSGIQDPTTFSLPLFTFSLLGILSLVLRWRRAVGDVRQQIKWLALFLSSAGTLMIGTEILGTIIFPAVFEGWFYLAILTVFFLGFPIVLGLAIFKYRLYDIDIIIRRTLSYALLTGVLAGIYFGSVITIQSVFGGFLGGGDSPVIVVLSTLAIAALFNPLRSRIQHFIDRRYYRRKFDAEQTLADFAAAARDEVNLRRLSEKLLEVVGETVQPETASLWIKQE